MAAYAARVGMEAFVFMPADTPIVNQLEAAYYGARQGAALEGIPFAPEAGACLGVLELLVAEKAIHPDERVVIFNTGAAQKYVEAIGSEPLGRLPQSVDWSTLSS